MLERDAAKYAKNALYQVIARLDFIRYYEDDVIFSELVLDSIKKNYPIAQFDQVMRFGQISIAISTNQSIPPNVQNKILEGKLKTFSTSNNESIVQLSNSHVVFIAKKYATFEDFLTPMSNILKSINNITAIRIGIRYINLFNSSTIRPMKAYFKSPYSGFLAKEYISQGKQLSMTRSLCLSEFSFNDMRLMFRYGLYNSGYPNKISEHDFTLDFDCFTQESTTSAEHVEQFFKSSHNAIQELFESTITDNLRKVMGNV